MTDVADALQLFEAVPYAAPRLDDAAVEQARLIRATREHLATTGLSVTYEGLAAGRSSSVEAARQWVTRARAARRIFTVDYDGNALIPSFQLDEAFDLDNRAAGIVKQLTDFGLSGWAIWRWFTAVNPWIDAPPVNVLDDPELLAQAVNGLISQ